MVLNSHSSLSPLLLVFKTVVLCVYFKGYILEDYNANSDISTKHLFSRFLRIQRVEELQTT